MSRPFLFLLLLLQGVPAPGQGGGAPAGDPRDVLLAARHAVEGDSVARVRGRWEQAVRRAPVDRAAQLGLATLARLTNDYAAADRAYAALVATDPARDDAVGAYARVGRALNYRAQNLVPQTVAAMDTARVALAAARRPELLAPMLEYLATQRPAAARQPAIDSGFAALGPADSVAIGEMHCARAAVDVTSDFARRAAAADTGLAIARRTGLRSNEAACHHSRAIVFLEQGLIESAIERLVIADSLFARAHNPTGRTSTLYRLGYRYLNDGQHGRARRAFRTGIAIADSLGAQRWSVLNRWGAIQTAILVNDLPTAEEELRTAQRILGRTQDSTSMRFARTYEALIAQAAGDDSLARRLLDAMLPVWMVQETGVNKYTVLRDVARSAANLGDWDGALGYLARARAVVAEHELPPDLAADLEEDEGRIALQRGELGAAERLLTRALGRGDTTRHALRYGLRVQLAEVHAAQGDLRRAETELRAAGDALDRWRATLDDPELRLLATELRENGGQEAGVPKVLAALAAGGRVAEAFELAERRRARELVTRMSEAEALREGDAPGGLRERAARLGATVGAAELAAALPDERTALLEYVTGERGTPTTLFVVTRRGVQAVRLAPVDSLATSIARFVQLLEEGTDPAAVARALGAAVLAPAVALLDPGVTQLVVVPDGQLHRVPFDALRLADGRHAVERFTVSVAPSATVARELWRRPRRAAGAAAPPRILAFGDPAFAGEGDAAAGRDGAMYRAAFDSAGGLPRLAGSGREARLVARHAPAGETRLRGDASEAFLKHAPLAEYGVLHFATHALVDERTMARTALALAPGAGEDGFVSPGDLATLPIGADLVVLSACRTAGGRLLGGEGVGGLTSPLLQAGARSVVATGWRVSDERTVQIVADFYAALARGEPVAAALRSAKLAAIRRGAPPGDWGAFTVVGDPLVTVPLQIPPPAAPRWPIALAVGTLLAAGGGLWWMRRRQRA